MKLYIACVFNIEQAIEESVYLKTEQVLEPVDTPSDSDLTGVEDGISVS